MPCVRLELAGPVAHVVLDRPDKRNAMGPEFWVELPAAFAAIERDRSLRAVVLRAEGPAFTAGLDLMAMVPRLPLPQAGEGPDGDRSRRLHELIRELQRAITAVERCRIPVIAAIHGYCLGGGVDLITACDVRFAAASATFGVRETRIAMVADLGTLQRLPAIVGPGIARELVFTGRDFDADEALRIGLVNAVLPDAAAVRARAEATAALIAANPPLAVEGAKRVLNHAVVPAIDSGLEYVATWNAAHLVTQDLGVAVTAFATKQTPEFSGR
jgi:enoyl-CoA hydratase